MNNWKSTWSYRTLDFRLFQTLIKDETQRLIVKNNLSGSAVRLHFSNRFGVERVSYRSISVAPSYDMITAETRLAKPVTFAGQECLSLEPGQEAWSDEIPMKVQAGEVIAVTTYVEGRCLITCGVSSYPQPISRVYNSLEGDYSASPYFPTKAQVTYFRQIKDEPEVSFVYGVDGIDVLCGGEEKTIVCFGDSITHHSRWSGAFTDRVYREYPGKYSVVNAGIGGNRILHGAYDLSGYGGLFGEAGVERFERDVFGRGSDVDLVIVLEGINDIQHPVAHYSSPDEKVTAQQLIEGLKTYAEISHRHGAKTVACTLMPFYNFLGNWTEEGEKTRQGVNEWIRNNDVFDGYLDFDQMVRSEEDPKRLSELCDSGDHIHPGMAGGIVIANEIDLKKLVGLV